MTKSKTPTSAPAFPRWRYLSDEHPVREAFYLCYDRDAEMMRVALWDQKLGFFLQEHKDERDLNIDHWMPLPRPPFIKKCSSCGKAIALVEFGPKAKKRLDESLKAMRREQAAKQLAKTP